MLKKKFRLNLGREGSRGFRIIFRGLRFIIKARDNNLPYSRVGVILNKKISLSAVKRNWLKRQVFDFFSPDPPGLAFWKPGKDIIVLFLPLAKDLINDPARLKQELENGLSIQ
jgi:ribonuclease P protein component